MCLALGLLLPGCEPGAGPERGEGAGGEIGTVEFEEVATLDFAAAPMLPSDGGLLARDPVRGGFGFVDRQFPHQVVLFSDDGTPLGVVGGRGEGPGEYELIDVRGSTILLLDYDANDTILWITSGVPASGIDVPRVRETPESGDRELMRGLQDMLIDYFVAGVDPRSGALVAARRFDSLRISAGGPWQYEVAEDHTTVRVIRPRAVR